MPARVDLTVGPKPTPEVEATPGDTFGGDGLADELEAVADVDPSVVRGLLSGLGRGLNAVAADEDVPDAWRFTPGELDDLAPPLTRIINRRPALKRAVMRGDEATVAIVLAGYTGRNVSAIRQAREAREDGDEQGQAGAAARPHGTGAQSPAGRPPAGGPDGGGVRGPAGGGVG